MRAEQVVTGTQEAGTWALRDDVLTRIFVDHCAVVFGHFLTKYWKRLRKADSQTLPYGVCTCLLSTQHAEFEHHAFVSALRGGPPNLNAVPCRRCGGVAVSVKMRRCENAPA